MSKVRKEKNKVKIKIQFGFLGINDIKYAKIFEAKRVFGRLGRRTVLIHFDLFNKQVAFVKLNEIKDNDMNWITRINRSDGLVWNIDQNFFFLNMRILSRIDFVRKSFTNPRI